MLRVTSITGHLLWFGLALALPILLMSGIIGWAYVHQEAKRIEALAERQALTVAHEIDSHLAAFQAALKVLSLSPTLLEGDVEDVRRRLEWMGIPNGIWFVLRDRSGQQLLNTGVPVGQALPSFAAQGDPVIFGEGKPFYSNLIWAPVANTWATTVSVPVRSSPGGEVQFSLSTAIPAAYLQRLLEHVPDGWIATINDRSGKIVARSLKHEHWVGKPMARMGWETTKDVPPGQGGVWRDIYTLEGIRVVGAYRRMESTGWLIGISALPEIYQAPRRNILLLGSALAVASLLLATGLAFLMGRRITGAIDVLQVKASAMRDGRVTDLKHTSVKEVNTVAESMDATARALRARHEQQTTLIQELNHRVKNTLATIQSISRMTVRGSRDMDTFEEAFSARLLALSTTHDLLTQSAWSGVELHELLATELKPFQASRVSFAGPGVNLSSKVAVALGMAVHEMATNATKYGPLQGSDGSIQIRWCVSDDTLTLHWSETRVRKIDPPTRQGFGSRLIQQTIGRELQGTVNTAYHDNGLDATWTIPLNVEDRLIA